MMTYTPSATIELMKILHCLSHDNFFEMMGCDPDDDPSHYMNSKYLAMKKDMFEWLCQLDSGNQRIVFEYAEKKAIWYQLKRDKI